MTPRKSPQLSFASVLISGAAALCATPASADMVDYAALEALFNEPVTTSATGAPQRTTEAPVNMTIISQEQIRQSGAIDLPGVLERLANVDVMRTFAGQADVSIRGYNTPLSPRLLVLVNGRQVYLDHYGMTNWDAIPVQLSEIRQIEVVTGPNTALFGFNAVAGVVNILTYDALNDDVDEATARVGAPYYVNGALVWSFGGGERFGGRLSFGGFDTEALGNDDAASYAFHGQPSVDPMSRSAAFNGAYQFTPRARLDVETTWTRSERTYRYSEALLANPYESSSAKATLSLETDFGLVEASAYSNYLEAEIENRIDVASLSVVAKPAPAHTLRIAGELRRNDISVDGGHLRYNLQALAGMWGWQVTEDFALTTALRYDALQLERTGAIPPFVPFTLDDYDREIDELSFNVGGVYRLTDRDSLRLTVARGAGLPSLIDLGYSLTVSAGGILALVSGDPTIAPLVVYNAEAGWDRDIGAINGRLRTAVFWQRNEDLRSFGARREFLSLMPPVIAALPANIGESDMYGVEARLEGRHGRWSWDAHYSWRHLDDEIIVPLIINQTDFEGTTPEHVFTAGLLWNGDRWELGGDVRYTSDTIQYGSGANMEPRTAVDDYLQLNARAAYQMTDNVTVELSARNLLESRTQTVGLTPVERSAYLTLRLCF